MTIPTLSTKVSSLISAGLHPVGLVVALVLLFFRERLGVTLTADELLGIFAGVAGVAAAFERRKIAPAMRERLSSEATRAEIQAIAEAVEQAQADRGD